MQEKLTTIELSGKLGKLFGKQHKFYVSSPAEAVRALCSQVKGFDRYMGEAGAAIEYAIFVDKQNIDPKQDLHNLNHGRTVRIAPVLRGAKTGGLLQTIVGAVLIVVGVILIATPFGAPLITAGIGMVAGGVIQMLSPQPKLNISEASANTPNKSFTGAVNTSTQGQPVPIVYGGPILVGSAVISAGIFAEDITY